MFNPVAPYGYMLPTLYVFMADIENPDLFVCGCRTWICLDITRFMGCSAIHPAGPHGRLGRMLGIWIDPILRTLGVYTLKETNKSAVIMIHTIITENIHGRNII